MKVKTTLVVQWTAGEIETVPVVSTTGLEILAVDRLLQFVRTHKSNYGRYSPANDPQRGKPTLVF